MKKKNWIQTLFPIHEKGISEGVRTNLKYAFLDTDRFMIKLLMIHWVLASTVMAYSYGTYLLGFIGGGFITLTAFFVTKLSPGTLISRIVIGVAFMAFSILFIQQHLGRLEMHFHIFVSMAFFINYKDIAPVLSAAVTIAVHHVLFNLAQYHEVMVAGTPIMVFDYGCGWDIVAIHAAFVVAATFVYSSIILNLTREYLKNAEVFNIIDQLKDSADYTNQAAELISDSGQTLALDSSNSLTAITESNDSLEKMEEKIKELNQKTEIVQSKVSSISIETRELNKSLKELQDSGKSVTAIIDIIESIALQTNLLALNAAIEAARAGEAGAGFTVVTEEVRQLAKKTSEAAADIGKVIQNNVERAESGSLVSDNVTESVVELEAWVSEVDTVSKDQLIHLNTIREMSEQIRETTSNTSKSAEKNASTAEQLQGQVQLLKNAIAEINKKTALNGRYQGVKQLRA